MENNPIPVVEVVEEPAQPQAVFVAAPRVEISSEQNVKMVPLAYNEETIDEESMRNALADLVKSKIFWGKKAVKQMNICNIQTFSSYYCVWETFMESRSTKEKTRPYKGGIVDGAQNGYPPQPWDIPITYPPLFHKCDIKVAIPHTETVQQCSKCAGRGRVQCNECYGNCKVICHHCNGSGERTVNEQRVKCTFCDGRGRVTCGKCHGDGRVKCKKCEGCGQLIHYIQLKVEFEIHKDEEFVDLSDLDHNIIRDSIGTTICSQSGFHILPPQDVFQPEVREACNRLFMKAEGKINENKERLLQQRVNIKVIPVAKAVGTWKNKNCDFWVHGNNKVAYAPRYLKEFYHGCNIMLSICFKTVSSKLYYYSSSTKGALSLLTGNSDISFSAFSINSTASIGATASLYNSFKHQ